MKVALVTYMHSSNGISLHVEPETDVERELLRGLWRHGKLATANSHGDDKSGIGFCIEWKQDRPAEPT